jgi:hypothetical protein
MAVARGRVGELLSTNSLCNQRKKGLLQGLSGSSYTIMNTHPAAQQTPTAKDAALAFEAHKGYPGAWAVGSLPAYTAAAASKALGVPAAFDGGLAGASGQRLLRHENCERRAAACT